MITLEENLKRLNDILNLEADWNGYGSPPIPKYIVDSATEIVKQLQVQPEIFPTGRATVQIEYDSDDRSYFEAELYENAAGILVVPYHDMSKAETKNIPIENVVEEVKKWLEAHPVTEISKKSEIEAKLNELRALLTNDDDVSYCINRLRLFKKTLPDSSPALIPKRAFLVHICYTRGVVEKKLTGSKLIHVLLDTPFPSFSEESFPLAVWVKHPGMATTSDWMKLTPDFMDEVLPKNLNDLMVIDYIAIVDRMPCDVETKRKFIQVMKSRMTPVGHLYNARRMCVPSNKPSKFTYLDLTITSDAVLLYLDMIIKEILPMIKNRMLDQKDPRRSHYAVCDIFTAVSNLKNEEWAAAEEEYKTFWKTNFM